MESSDNKNNPGDDLLSDQEFTDLMLARYDADGRSVDILAKKRTWAELVDRIREHKEARVSKTKGWGFGIAVAAVALFAVTFKFLPFHTAPDEDSGFKGHPGNIPLTLTSYTLGAEGESSYMPDDRKEGTRIFFRALLTQGGHMALIKVNAEGMVETIVDDQFFEAGDEGAVKAEDNTFIYTLNKEDEVGKTRFCALASETAEQLADSLEALKGSSYSVDGSCISL